MSTPDWPRARSWAGRRRHARRLESRRRAEQMPNYFAQPMPCHIERQDRAPWCARAAARVKSLRELSIARNTIYARYGWDGYRKPWLRDYFHSQPWFKPNPKFTYKQLADDDRKNAHFIAVREQSLTDVELRACATTLRPLRQDLERQARVDATSGKTVAPATSRRAPSEDRRHRRLHALPLRQEALVQARRRFRRRQDQRRRQDRSSAF